MTFPLPARRRVALPMLAGPILAGLILVSAPAWAQQRQLYGGTGYGSSIVGAYNPYLQAGPGQTSGRAYGTAPVPPYPPAYGPVTAQMPAPPAPSAAPAGAGPRVPYAAPPPSGQVGAYNPWRPQPVGGYSPTTGSRPPAFYAPYGPYTDVDAGANLPPPPPGPIRSRLLSIPEAGSPQGSAAPFQSVPYAPRRSGAVQPPRAPRVTTAAATATPPAPQIASGGTTDTAPPPPTMPPRAATPPRSAAKPAEPKVAAAPPPEPPKPAPAAAAPPPEPPKPAPVAAEPPKPAPAPPVVAAKPPEPAKPAPAPPVVAAKPPEPPKPAPAPPVVAAKPAEPPKPATAVFIERPTQSAAAPLLLTKPPTAPAGPTRIVFESNTPALTADARASLDRLAADLIANPSRKTTLKAYSAGGSGPETRRLSLARGLAVRAYLIDKGVPRDRLDVQALGTSAEGGPADRVDAIAGTGT